MLEIILGSKRKQKQRTSNNLLLHFDGVNGSKTFIDSYPGNGAVNVVGNPTLSSLAFKFAPTSGAFNNESLALELPIVLKQDYTISGWINLGAYPPVSIVLALASDDSKTGVTPPFTPLGILCGNGSTYYLARWIAAFATPLALAPVALPLNTWLHVESTRQNNVYRNFLNGALVMEATGPIVEGKITHLLYHASNVSARLKGFADEIEVLDGVCRHTAAFTPPTSPYTN